MVRFIHVLVKILIVVIIFALIDIAITLVKRNSPEPERTFVKSFPKPKYAYKIRIDSLNVVYDKVRPNENLGNILSSFVSPRLIDRIAKGANSVFDVRKIRPGQTYARIVRKASAKQLLFFVYEIDPIDFVVYDFRDSLRVYLDHNVVKRVQKTASGTIISSLWNTIDENDLDVNLVLSLSDVYAWTVDFYGLQKGDHFRVIYEQLYVDSIPTGNIHILSSCFNSSGRDIYAFYFEQKNSSGYFDENGKSLRRSFLKAPLHFSRISSRYSRARMHPILRIVRPHFGVDYAAPRGTPVVALGDGKILEAGWKGGYGRFISVRHNSVYTSTYAHLSGYSKGIHPGAIVKQGDVIGFVGSSGLATGAHLDFRVYKNGSPVDPLKVESPPTDPVESSKMKDYAVLVSKMIAKLDSITPN